jgi:hypothetical protein
MLRDLTLNSCSQVSDLEPLSRLHSLKNLIITGMPSIVSLYFLNRLTNLTSLTLEVDRSTSELGPLGNLKKLRFLRLVGHWSSKDLNALGQLVNLTDLHLEGKTDMYLWFMNRYRPVGLFGDEEEEFSLVRALGFFDERLVVSRVDPSPGPHTDLVPFYWVESYGGFPEVKDLSPLKNLKGVKRLTLGGIISVSDLRPISELEQLAELFIIGVDVDVSLDPLSHLDRDNSRIITTELSSNRNMEGNTTTD